MNEKDYIGKLVLLGLTFENEPEGWTEQHQLHGRVRSFRGAFIELTQDNGDLFLLPFNPSGLLPADPGLYCERRTGVEIKDPDFLVCWTISDAKRDLIPSYLKHGFADFISREDVQPSGLSNPHSPSAQGADGR